MQKDESDFQDPMQVDDSVITMPVIVESSVEDEEIKQEAYKTRLLLGEGDFSYCYALLKKHENNHPELGHRRPNDGLYRNHKYHIHNKCKVSHQTKQSVIQRHK